MVRRGIYDSFKYPMGIGPDGSSNYVKGSETSFLLDIEKAGHQVVFFPGAYVKHIVQKHEIGIKPVLQRYYNIGRGNNTLGLFRFDENTATLFGWPRYLFRSLPPKIISALSYSLIGKSSQAMDKLIEVAVAYGAAAQWKLDRSS
jgi:hypothetical protein